MAASWKATIRVSQLAYTATDEKAALRATDMHRGAVDEFNNVVAQIELVADQELVVLAIRIDDEFKRLWRDASQGQYSRDDWRPKLGKVNQALKSFLVVARKSLGSPKLEIPVEEAPDGSIFRA